jgi:moderate conductance mechanosensitive channel
MSRGLRSRRLVAISGLMLPFQRRWAASALVVFCALAPVAALAQSPAAPAATASPPAAAIGTSIANEDLQKLVATLKDDKARTQLIDQLNGLIAAQQGGQTKPPPATQTGIIGDIAGHFNAIGGEILDTADLARAAPRLVHWLDDQATSPDLRARWLATIFDLCGVFLAAALSGFVLLFALRGLRRRLAARPGGSPLAEALRFAGTYAIEVLPILGFVAVATLVLGVLRPGDPAQPVAETVIEAILYAQLLVAFLRLLLVSPRAPGFIQFGDETRAYLYIWARRFVFWAIYGYAVAQSAWWLGVPGAAYALLLRGTTFILGGLAIVFVLQNRASVAQFLRGAPAPAGAETSGTVRMLRAALADIWHILAIVYILGSFGTFVVNIQGGFIFVLRATLVSVAVVLLSALAVRFVRHLSQDGLKLGGDIRARFPGLQTRTNRYLPALVVVLSVVVYAAAVVVLLQAWGVAVFDWLATSWVRDMIGSIASIVVVIVIAIMVWELFSAGMERALVGREGPRQVSARMRTLLPLFRTATLIAIITVAAFIVLSQIGVNIAPLLAGAGIVGIAIGFGSQKLVQDLITGLFLLLERAVQIGDSVTVSGLSGTVEDLSIRTIRLRAPDGAVHIIPFSSVTSVTNSNRDIGNAAVSITVPLAEDTDRVSKALRDIAAELRRDAKFKVMMLTDLDLWGVDKIDGASQTIVGQIVCTDAGRWPVQREFNRRVKDRFHELGIALALPTQAVVVQDAGAAARIEDTPPPTRLERPARAK